MNEFFVIGIVVLYALAFVLWSVFEAALRITKSRQEAQK